ncbi:23S rRNA (pseudouridine1915-N3)-methyltransferase [Peptostreptococcaceae bacterium pGA-8]|nr:23S rRNA (pseudouridine1915-N3)-methyltransferase [Peptostreptococcaceae bacterium pGA-8]
MNITVICIGKLKEKYWADAIKEYMKRLSAYCKVQIIELKEFKVPERASAAEEQIGREREGEDILKSIKDNQFVITLEVWGKSLSSEEFAHKLQTLSLSGNSNIAIVIGGSTGIGENVRRRSDFQLSFSNMTFPHQMIRVILLEQIYRAFKISKGEPYHK